MSEPASPPRTNLLKRLFCIQVSPPPEDPGCLELDGDQLTVHLDRAPELAVPGGALRLDDPRLPDRLLLVRGPDGQLLAYRNRCACGGFRVDPVPGEPKIRCCTLAQSTYDLTGAPLSGPAKQAGRSLDLLPLQAEGQSLRVDLAPIRSSKPPHQRREAAAS